MDYRSGEREFQTIRFFHLITKKKPFKEHDVCKIIAEVGATNWRLRECIWMRELAATHRLELMLRLRMLEEQEAWKRETGFDRIEIIAQIDAQHFPAGFDSEHLYSKLYNSR